MYDQADAHSSVINQMLYGDHYKVKEVRKHYLCIELQYDQSKGWIHRNQFHPLAEENVQDLNDFNKAVYNDQPIGYVIDALDNSSITTIRILNWLLKANQFLNWPCLY